MKEITRLKIETTIFAVLSLSVFLCGLHYTITKDNNLQFFMIMVLIFGCSLAILFSAQWDKQEIKELIKKQDDEKDLEEI